MKTKQVYGVPAQIKGAFHDTESQKKITDPDIVLHKFEILKNRFFSINEWKKHCGTLSADFKLYDNNGIPADRTPREGDFIRVDIPGPGDFEARGYDWVEIMNIDNNSCDGELERYLIKCQPSRSPQSKDDRIRHFFSRESTSTFIISRGMDFIKVGIYGRNEMPNYDKKGILLKIRNFIISLVGFAHLTKIQWKCLSDGLLDL
ncbi:MAG: hypothetical protein E2590_03780 [Chryseobacterium sp.]|nr:hypothetical protein [Chryseobacterium sp.]